MNKEKDNEEIYDILKDNPRWKSETEEVSSVSSEENTSVNQSDEKTEKIESENKPKEPKIPEIISEEEDVISDIPNEDKEKDASEFLFEDENSELEAKAKNNQGNQMSADKLLENWKNEETQKRNDEAFKRSIEERRNKNYTFYHKSNSGRILGVLWVIAAVLIIFSIYCMVVDVRDRLENTSELSGVTNESIVIETSEIPSLDKTESYVDENGKYTTEGVAQKVLPSVVSIECFDSSNSSSENTIGSGIIITADGCIATNYHVLEGSETFVVTTNDGTEYNAEIKGFDAKTDIAVIKIDAANLTPAEIGDSSELVVGEEVVAIGNPAGYAGTVTNGIVSALDRQIESASSGYKIDCIQTNTAISPGNSGGALVNMYGQVVGIISSKYISESYEGIGFAITVNQALPVINQLITNGFVEGRVKVGITFVSLEEDEAENYFNTEYGISIPDGTSGLWVTEISEECDIASTDLQVGDIITTVDGEEVTNASDLSDIILTHEVGDTLTAKCLRFDKDGNSTEFTISFELEEDTSGSY